MKHIYFAILILFCITLLPAFTKANPDLNIVYPKNNANINAPSTFLIGSTDPKDKLTVNNETVKVYPNGGFVHMVGLKRGANTISIKSISDNNVKELIYTINVPEYEKTIPHSPLKIDKSSIKPDKDIIYQAGDVINIKFKGATGNNASFSIGNVKDIPMIELPAEYSKTPIAFGKAFDTSKQPVKGMYNGIYKIQESDNFKDTPISVKLSSKDDSITEIANAKVTIIHKDNVPIIAEVKKDNATVRNAPDKARLTPLPKGTRINITGKIGNDYRFQMGEFMEGWISADSIEILPAGTPLAQSVISSVKVESKSDSVLIKIPLSQRLPVSIEELPFPQLDLTIYGGVSEVDLLPYNDSDKFIKEIKLMQASKSTFKLYITPNSKQFWGYDYYYEDNTFILKLKKPPVIDTSNVLKNKIITIDPGHGGKELGSVGPTGIPEKTVNLEIAKYLKTKLENSGARVIMTRNNDNQDVSLYKRIEIANDNDSQVLLSIHNNALPDGRDPYKEHGSSVYYYHSHSLPLAKSIQDLLLQNLGFKNFGIFWDSLALTRPHQPIAVLVEVGFMINPDEYNLLITKDFQKKAADAIYQGLENFYKNSENKI